MTPHGRPADDRTARLLDRYFAEPAAARVLASLLLEHPAWPDWKRRGITMFLGMRADPLTLPLLVRLSIADADQGVRELATEAMGSFAPGDIIRALDAEARWWAGKAGA